MLESVVANVLNRFLAAYVDNLNTNQLNVGIWSGDVKLRNLKLKKEALDKFRLPVDVTEGYLGELTCNIPWSNLKAKPVKVFIDNVYLLASPTDSSKSTPEEDEERAQAAKREKLESAELMNTQPSGMSAEEEKKNDSFMSSLVTKIVNNLQIEVHNIHIRYEDNLSVPGHPFSAGITLAGFSAVSTDEFWKPAFITESAKGIHKLAKLQSLAVYFDTDSESIGGYETAQAQKKFTELIARDKHIPDHQFILKPVSGEGRLILNHKVNADTPKTDAELLFEELGFVLDEDQYRDALSMVDLFHFYIRQREYRRYRPPIEEFKENRARALWKFAINAIQTEVHEKHRQWSWAYLAERRDDRKSYVSLFKAKQRQEIVQADLELLDNLERKLSYKDIRFYRSIARSELRKERAIERENAPPQPQQQQKKGGGWLGWIGWGGGGGHKDEEDPASTLTAEQRKELYDAIEWDEKEAVAASVDLPKDALLMRVKAKLQTGSFALRTDPHGKNRDLIALNFDDFQLDLLQRPDNFETNLGLGGLRVFDGTLPNTVHPQIVRVKENKAKERLKALSMSTEDQEADEDGSSWGDQSMTVAAQDPFFFLKFEHNPLDGRADNAFSMRLRHMEIIYHRGYVEAIVKFFKPPESQLESVSALLDVASSTLEGIRKETRAGLEFALAQHKTVDVQLDLNAPIIIVPEDVTRQRCQHLVLDAGHISVESELADQSAVDQVKAKEKQEYSEEDFRRLENLMYDKFHVKLESAQLLLGPTLEQCLAALSDKKGRPAQNQAYNEMHILERTSLSFLAQNCIVPTAPNLTRFKVSGSLPTLQLNISDRKYKNLMRMIDVAIPKFDDGQQQQRAQPTAQVMYRPQRVTEEDDDELHHVAAHHSPSESEDEGSDSDSEADAKSGKDVFFETPDIEDGTVTMRQKTFEFAFKVNRVQASIYRSGDSSSAKETLLANAVLEGFQLEFAMRPFDMSVDILLRSLYLEDKMTTAPSSEFRHLITSERLDASDSTTPVDLVHIKYMGVQKTSPEFMTVHEGIDKTVDIEFSTLNIIVTRASILKLFDWVMTTFTDNGAPQAQPDLPEEQEQTVPDGQEASPDKMRVKVKLTSINLIMNEDGLKLGTLSLSAADVTVMMRAPTMRVNARIGDLSLDDDFTSKESREMLSIQGGQLADFQYETFDPHDSNTYPGYDTLVHLRTGSLKFTFREEPLQRILSFFSKFARMKAVYDAATAAAAQQASEVANKISKMKYDILVKTPIVVFPRADSSSTDVIQANLGEIAIVNRFEEQQDKMITHIDAALRSVHLSSTMRSDGHDYKLDIVEDITLDVHMQQVQAVNGAILREPGSKVKAKMTDVKMNLTESQYAFVMEVLRRVPQAFATPPDAEAEEEARQNGIKPPPKPAPPPVPPKEQHKLDDEANGAVDLLPELSHTARAPDGHEVELVPSMEATFSIGTVNLELFTASALDEESLKNASLAKFALNQTDLKYRMMTNGSMEAELTIRSFTLNDTRSHRKTQFREIIPATKHSGHQFMINYTQSGGADKSSIASLTIDTPKFIFSLDPLFALSDYFSSAFRQTQDVVKDDEDAEKDGDQVDDDVVPQAAADQDRGSFAYRVNVVAPTIILLENPEKADSEAITLSLDQVLLSQQGTLALSASQVGMFLCRMDRPKERIRVVDNFDITLSMDSRSDGGRQATNIEIAVQALVLRLSTRDVFLVQSIINRASELSKRPEPESRPATPPAPAAVETTKEERRVSRQRAASTAAKSRKRSNTTTSRLEAQLLLSKENLRAAFDGFHLILISDMHDLPVLDVKAKPFSANVTDWSSDLDASITIAPQINFYNLRVSHWEPLIDPWEFSILASRNVTTGLLAVTLLSRKRLEVNVTSTFIELAMTTMALVDREGEKVFSKPRGANAPFRIRNRTGYPVSLWSEASEKADKAEPIENGKDIAWRFEDWKTAREHTGTHVHNTLSILVSHDQPELNEKWDKLRHVSVDREGEKIYALRPKIERVTHRLLVEVKLVENVKIVTLRSTFQVENRTLVATDVQIVDSRGKPKGKPSKIPPGEDCPIPILDAYWSRIKLRPTEGFGYNWSSESFHWQDLVKKPTRSIACRAKNEAAFRFQAYTVHDKTDPMLRSYPKLSLRLRAPIEIQNLLPYDVRFRVFDKNQEHNWTSFLVKGGVSPIHVAELSHLLLLSVDLQESAFERSEFAIINTDNPEDLPVENELVLADKDGLKLNLRIHYQKHADAGGAFRIQVYSPYILVNKTGSEFALKTKSSLSSPKNVAGQAIFSKDHKRHSEEPFMFSYPSVDRRNRALLRINDSQWSQPLSFETVGLETEVVLKSPDNGQEMHIGLRVSEGLSDYKITKVVTLYPRFIVKNRLNRVIRFREVGSKDEVALTDGHQQSLGYLRAGRDPQLTLAFASHPTEWSAAVPLRDVGQNHVRVQEAGEEKLVRVEVTLSGACIFVQLHEETGSWPIVLRNDSDYPLTIAQGSENEQDLNSNRPRKSYQLAAGSKMSYAWDVPAAKEKLIRVSAGGKERLLNIFEIGSQLPFRFPHARHNRVISIDVVAEGPTQAVYFSNYSEEESIFKLQRRNTDNYSRAESVASSREAEFEAETVEVVTSFSIGVSLEGIGISIVNKRMHELVYASFRGITAKYSDSTTNVQYDLGIKWIQIDNQLYGGIFPILLYPSVIPKDGKELEIHPSLQASAIILKDQEHGVTYVKYASLLLQQMTIEVDEDFLFALLDFGKFSGATGVAEAPSRLLEEPEGIPEPTASTRGGDLYFEVLHLQPVQLDLSFMRTERVNVDQKLNTRNPLFFFINALTMALGNVNDAPVQLNALVIENVRLSLPVLQERLALHYSQDFYGQIYRVLGSADFLGNPVGLFTNVSSGVADFFIQPYDSVMMNGNRDLGIGIARGAGSLAKKTVFGISDSFAKITGSVGKGLSAATLDKQYQSQRRMRQVRNKPKHALYGVTAGAQSFVTSVASGFEGLATKPLEGAEEDGAVGFFKGMGKGLVGAVTKPVVGVFDLANNITEGIRNTTTVFDQNALDRVRMPRFISADGILRPYSEREALGQNWLKNVDNGKYFDETYVAHLDLASSEDSVVVLLTTTRVLLVKVLKLRVEWDVPFSTLQTISLEPSGISLALRDGRAGPFLAVTDQAARIWLFRHFERVVAAYNNRRTVETV